MAKYEDYVKALDTEIDEAVEGEQKRQSQDAIPERFRGKSAEEIARAYAELESLHGRTAQQLGDLRNTVDKLVQDKIMASEPAKPAPEKKPVTVDEIYDNADAALRRVVREESQSRIEELERKLQEAEQRATVMSARAAFEARHPDYQSTAADPAFLEWIKASPYRIRQAQAADRGDFDAADELFSTYDDRKVSTQTEAPSRANRREQVRKAGLESSGSPSAAPVEKYSRSKLESLRVRARQGDPEADRYMLANAEDIRRAYEEGRLTN